MTNRTGLHYLPVYIVFLPKTATTHIENGPGKKLMQIKLHWYGSFSKKQNKVRHIAVKLKILFFKNKRHPACFQLQTYAHIVYTVYFTDVSDICW